MTTQPDAENTHAAPGLLFGSVWQRAAAVTLDAIILGILLWAVFSVLSPPALGAGSEMIVLCCLYFYYTGFEASPMQATLGKFAVGVRVTDMNGGRISFARANARFVGKLLPFIFVSIFDTPVILPFVPVLLSIPFNARKQHLHDVIAKTCVIEPPCTSASAIGFRSLFKCVGVALFLFGLFVYVSCPGIDFSGKAVLRANMTAVGTRGKDIYIHALIPAWEEMQGKAYTTSTDYFNDLLKTTAATNTTGVDMSKFAGAGIKPSSTGVLTAENNMWAVLVNAKEEDSDMLPLLITRNVDIEALNRALKTGISSSDFSTRIALGTAHQKPFGKKGFVLTRKGGTVSSSTGRYCTLGVIFNNTEIPSRPEGEPPLMYLSP